MLPKPCDHPDFHASVGVHRMSREEGGPISSFMAEIRVQCTKCGRPFQFLGLQPGIDLQGARVSVDGLEANIAIVPQGEELSPLDRMVVNFAGPKWGRH